MPGPAWPQGARLSAGGQFYGSSLIIIVFIIIIIIIVFPIIIIIIVIIIIIIIIVFTIIIIIIIFIRAESQQSGRVLGGRGGSFFPVRVARWRKFFLLLHIFIFAKHIFQIDIHIRVACNVNKISQTSSQIDICI